MALYKFCIHCASVVDVVFACVNAVQLQMAGLLSVQWSFTASDVYDIITSDFKYIQKALRYQK